MFEQIKKDSPDAWERFEKYIFEKVGWEFKHGRFRNDSQFFDDIYFLIGLLFTFFDEQGIRIAVIPHTNGTFRPYLFRKAGKVWTFLELEDYEYGFSERLEAWKAAIPKAFEILQKQLEEK